MTQKDLAERLGIDQSAVTLWETGKAAPRFFRLQEIANALGCTVDDLVSKDSVSETES